MTEAETLSCPHCSTTLEMREAILEPLTLKKRQIAVMWAQGAQQKEIAFMVGKETHCVSVHIQQIYKKLGVGSQRELTLLLYGILK